MLNFIAAAKKPAKRPNTERTKKMSKGKECNPGQHGAVKLGSNPDED